MRKQKVWNGDCSLSYLLLVLLLAAKKLPILIMTGSFLLQWKNFGTLFFSELLYFRQLMRIFKRSLFKVIKSRLWVAHPKKICLSFSFLSQSEAGLPGVAHVVVLLHNPSAVEQRVTNKLYGWMNSPPPGSSWRAAEFMAPLITEGRCRHMELSTAVFPSTFSF